MDRVRVPKVLASMAAILMASSMAWGQAGAAADQAQPGKPAQTDTEKKEKKGKRHQFYEIEKVEGQAITLKDREGQSQTVQVGQDVSVKESVQCDPQALKPGDGVRAIGIMNQDGTFTAKRITVGAEIRARRRGKDDDVVLTGTVESNPPLKVKDDVQIVQVSLAEEVKVERIVGISLDNLAMGDFVLMRSDAAEGAPIQVKEMIRVPKEAAEKVKQAKERKKKRVDKKADQP